MVISLRRKSCLVIKKVKTLFIEKRRKKKVSVGSVSGAGSRNVL